VFGEKALVPVYDGRLEEPRLTGEVGINQCFGHTGLFSDRASRRAGKAVDAKQIFGCRQDHLLNLHRGAAGSTSYGRHQDDVTNGARSGTHE
jgi:hypothetical protein